jgi:hypothetical protein
MGQEWLAKPGDVSAQKMTTVGMMRKDGGWSGAHKGAKLAMK